MDLLNILTGAHFEKHTYRKISVAWLNKFADEILQQSADLFLLAVQLDRIKQLAEPISRQDQQCFLFASYLSHNLVDDHCLVFFEHSLCAVEFNRGN